MEAKQAENSLPFTEVENQSRVAHLPDDGTDLSEFAILRLRWMLIYDLKKMLQTGRAKASKLRDTIDAYVVQTSGRS